MTCHCPHIHVGMERTEARNWNPDCPDHGVDSDWYQSPEQALRRAEQNRRLRDLQIRARLARRAHHAAAVLPNAQDLIDAHRSLLREAKPEIDKTLDEWDAGR